MADPYDRSSRRRGVLTHWVPLLLTVGLATAGVAAWAWSQRNRDDYYDDEDDDLDDLDHGKLPPTGQPAGPRPGGAAGGLDYEHADYGDNPAYGATSHVGVPAAGDNTIQLTDATLATGPPSSVGGWSTRMSGALGGAASPQQWVGNASKAVSAGVAAASAAVGGALASIREGDKDAYADHETWSEEADARRQRAAVAPKSTTGRKRKTVALVVAATSDLQGLDEDVFHEHASILSYIPRQTDFSKVRIFVLIYAPGLRDNALLDPASANAAAAAAAGKQPASLSSSFSNIAADAADADTAGQSPVARPLSAPPAPPAADGSTYGAVHAQALSLVERESDIIPFSSPNSHAHILHLLEPDVVYVQESLTGNNGAIVNQLQAWMRNDIVVVVGAEGGHGGLADSESEAEKPGADTTQKWWQREDRVGRGRGVIVVDGSRINDDWIRRVQEQE